MRRSSAKVAISVDADLLDRVERLRSLTGESRSALVSRALVKLTGAAADEARIRRYVEAYRALPEADADVTTARRLARKTLKQLPWDET